MTDKLKKQIRKMIIDYKHGRGYSEVLSDEEAQLTDQYVNLIFNVIKKGKA